MPSSEAMALMNQIPDPFAGRQLDKPFLGKLNHATDGLAAAILVKAAGIGQAGQSGGEHFVDRFKLAAGQLLLDDPLLLGFEFDGHTSNLAHPAHHASLGSCEARSASTQRGRRLSQNKNFSASCSSRGVFAMLLTTPAEP